MLGYGAGTINPYLAFETLDDMIRQGMIKGIDHDEAVYRYRKAIKKGVVKVMSKMGISTIHCYRGGQIFEAIGLNEDFVRRYFDKTATRIGGVGINEIAEETLYHHHRAFANRDARRPGFWTAASISGGATANITCSTPKPSSGSSTRPQRAGTTSSRNTPG